jgi:hypothetical protein
LCVKIANACHCYSFGLVLALFFICYSEGLLVLAHAAVVEAVKHHYKKCFSSEQNLMFHLLLSAYFYWEADPKGNKSFDGNNKRAMSELPYHLTSSGLWSELEAVVCNLQYIEQKCLLGLGRQLPNDFLLEQKDATIAQQWEPEKFLQQQTITEYHSFVSRNLHIISKYPKLCLQQALNEPDCSLVYQAAQELVASGKHVSEYLAWVNKPQDRDCCKMTLTGFNEAVTCVAVSSDKKYVACGSMDCTVKLYNLTTGRVPRKLNSLTSLFSRLLHFCLIRNSSRALLVIECCLTGSEVICWSWRWYFQLLLCWKVEAVQCITGWKIESVGDK